LVRNLNPPRVGLVDTAALDDPTSPCSIEQALGLVGDRWSMLVLRDTFRGLRRFDEIRRDLGIPRAVLSDRLRRLVDAGILARRRYQDHPPRDEYRLTEMGRELSPILVALMHWGDRWLQEGEPPTVLVHSACGEPLELGFHCSSCHVDFGPLEISSRHRQEAS